jgi:hypothetical protein
MSHAVLTGFQRAQIRLYLGWSARFHQMDSALEQAMNAVDANQTDDDTYNLITRATNDPNGPGLLASLVDVDTKLLATDQELEVKKVGSIELVVQEKVGTLRSNGRKFAGRLAALLGVPVRHDVFSGTAPRGPFMGMAGAGMGLPGLGGNLPPMG